MRSSAESRRRTLPRKLRRTAAAGSAIALLATGVLSGCGAAEHVTAGMRASDALERLGAQPTASLIASVDGSEQDTRRFLRTTQGTEPSDRAVRLLSRAEVTMTVGSGGEDTPLREMSTSDAMDVAAALNFGRTDVFAVKSVRDQMYVRVKPAALAEQTELPEKRRTQAEELVGLADQLPGSLRSAKDALQGKWVRLNPAEFDDFAQAAERLADEKDHSTHDGGRAAGPADGQQPHGPADDARKELAGTGALPELEQSLSVAGKLNGQSQREFVSRVESLLKEHARFADGGERGGAEHIEVSLPGRKAATDLSAALRPLGIDVEPSRMPDREVTADLAIRRGQLTEVTVDIGQFTGAYGKGPGSGGAQLPLKLKLGSGHAVSVEPPPGAYQLGPEDAVAALVYGALGSDGF